MKSIRGFVDRHPYASVFLIAFLVRAAVAVLFSEVFAGRFVSDDTTYSNMAKAVAADATDTWDPYTLGLFNRTITFVGPLALIYRVFGPVELWGQLFVALAGAGTAALAAKLVGEFATRGWALAVGAGVAFFPSQIVWSSVLLKDPLVWLVVAGIAVLVAVMNRASGMRVFGYLAGAGVLLSLLAHLRDHSFLIACWALMVAALSGVRTGRPQRLAGAFVVALVLPWMFDMGPLGIDYVRDQESLAVRRAQNARYANTAFVEAIAPAEEQPSKPVPPEDLVESDGVIDQLDLTQAEKRAIAYVTLREREDVTPQEVAEALDLPVDVVETPPPPQKAEDFREIARDVAIRQPTTEPEETAPTEDEVEAQDVTADLAHLPLGLFVMLMEPVPWESGGSLALRLARWEMIFWYPALVAAMLGLVAARRFLGQLVFPILFGGGILLVAGLTEGNIGTAYRHRGEFVWIVIVLAAVGAKWLVDRRTQHEAIVRSSNAPATLETARPRDTTQSRKDPVGTP